MIRSRCANCGSRTASRSARREGKEWFCSQSCLLEWESRFGHGRGFASVASPKRHGSVGWLFTLARLVRWTVTAIVLVVVTLVVTGARLGDVLGLRRAFVFGLAAFALASLAGGLSPTPATLILARALQEPPPR